MKVQYDQDIDAVYLSLNDEGLAASGVARSEEIAPGVVYDFDESNNLLGVEILFVQNRTHEELRQIDYLLTPEQIDEFRQIYKRLPV